MVLPMEQLQMKKGRSSHRMYRLHYLVLLTLFLANGFAGQPNPPGQVLNGNAVYEAYLFAHMKHGDYLYYLIMADDLGYECLSCNGSTSYKTPNLDKLAQSGARFTHCYVNPLCTPTRTPLMTGRYTFRHYTTFGCLPQAERTFGHMMRNAGYATCQVGKWQLAHGSPPGQTPDQAGFDEYFMKVDNDSKGYADPVVYSKNLEPMKIPGSYGPDLFYEFIAGFLERRRDEPFFLYYPMFLTHFDFKPTPDSPQWRTGDRHEKNKRFFPDMVAYMDKNVGRIIDKLDELGLRENTLVMFLGDNGTHRSITSHIGDEVIQGGKSWLNEAGTHVPMIVNWPGSVPAGQVRDELIDPTDFFATIREVTGAAALRPPGDGLLDGVSFLSRVTGRGGPAREWILIEYVFENRGRMFIGHEGRYVRNHRWKLYEKGISKRLDGQGKEIPLYRGGQLFDLQRDPDEEHSIEVTQDTVETTAIRARFQQVLNGNDMTHHR